jgi:hypothetical protein
MKFARIVFAVAAVYGLLILPPLYFLREAVGRYAPPAITHPELYYGIVGLAVLWQLVFVIIATDPARYRLLMLVAVLEKFVYTTPAVILYLRGDTSWTMVGPALVDPVLGMFFFAAYLTTRKRLRVPEHLE